MLLSSFHLLEGAPPELFRQRPLYVRFNGQVGSDWGGIRRAWIAKLSQELFDPRLGLVLPVFSKSGVPTGRLIINPVPYSSLDGSLTGLHEEELTRRYYRFMGRVIGIALIQGDTLAARMTSAFYKVSCHCPRFLSSFRCCCCSSSSSSSSCCCCCCCCRC